MKKINKQLIIIYIFLFIIMMGILLFLNLKNNFSHNFKEINFIENEEKKCKEYLGEIYYDVKTGKRYKVGKINIPKLEKFPDSWCIKKILEEKK